MKILLIHNSYKQPGGEDSVFRTESALLAQNGHEVDSMRYDNTSIKTFIDKLMSGLKSIYNPDSARALKAKIQDFNPDIIHVHNFLPIVSPSVLFVANRCGIPVVLTLHNYRLICPSATLFYKGHVYEKSLHSAFPFDAIWKGVYRNSIIQTAVVALITAIHRMMGTWRNKVDAYITLTQFAKEKFESSTLSIPAEKFFVKPNFVMDCGEGEAVRQKFFLFVGRLSEEKGIKTLLAAASIYKFRLTIIGDGPLEKMVESFARLHPYVHYLGFQEKPVVMSYLKRCSALIFPSIWYEGFPITILEAFSTGTPVIASNMGGMKEIIQTRVNGLLFEPGDEHDLAARIIEISEDEHLAKQLSANVRLSYQERYTPEMNCKQLVGIYDQMIKLKQCAS